MHSISVSTDGSSWSSDSVSSPTRCPYVPPCRERDITWIEKREREREREKECVRMCVREREREKEREGERKREERDERERER